MGAVTQLRRHGDVLLKTREGFQIPEDTKFLPLLKYIHRGTNHDHIVKSGKALDGIHGDKHYLRVLEDLTLDHEEHGEGVVPAGDYWVEIKQEYDHLSQESRAVVD